MGDTHARSALRFVIAFARIIESIRQYAFPRCDEQQDDVTSRKAQRLAMPRVLFILLAVVTRKPAQVPPPFFFPQYIFPQTSGTERTNPPSGLNFNFAAGEGERGGGQGTGDRREGGVYAAGNIRREHKLRRYFTGTVIGLG